MKTEIVKGFKDYIGEEAIKRAEVKKIIEETFQKYGFEPAETPIVEYEEFVKGENEKDEAISDIFKLKDKGNRELALRYEFTFQLKRLMNNKKLPYKRYQIGPVFRDEPVSANRFRQFIQCDIDTLGATTKDEAEILATIKEISEKLGIKIDIYVNNKKLLNEIFESIGIKDNTESIIREIDKLDKLPEKEVINNLKKYKADKAVKILKNKEEFFKRFNSYKEIEELRKYCNYYGVKIIFQPSLARGLSYYNGNVFEAKTKGMKETIVGGGAYLFNGVKGFGYGSGLDRWWLLSKIKDDKEKYLVVSLNQDKESIKLAQKLRNKDKSVVIYYGKPSKALEYANSYYIKKVIFKTMKISS
ncbi:MAG: HisS family protein [Nanoarchaeota archaeon]